MFLSPLDEEKHYLRFTKKSGLVDITETSKIVLTKKTYIKDIYIHIWKMAIYLSSDYCWFP